MKKFAAFAVLSGVVLVAGGILIAMQASDKDTSAAPAAQPAAQTQPSVPAPANPEFAAAQDGDIVFGDKNAKVTVTEYASLSCSHCADFHLKTFPDIDKKYIETGKIKFVFRDFPLNGPAIKGSALVRCVDVDKRKTALGTLYRTQNKWAFDKDFITHLQQIAIMLGLDKPSFEKCMNDKALEDSILKSRMDGSKELGVSGTPSLFVNGESMGPKHDAETLIQLIDAHLAKAQ